MTQIQPWLSREIGSLDTPTSSTNKTDAHFKPTLLPPPHILVRDPPRDQLPAEPGYFCENSVYLLTLSGQDTELPPTFLQGPNLISKAPRRERVRMVKKRRSLQSIFIPSFLTAPPSPTDSAISSSTSSNARRNRSYSTASQSKYPYALDNLELSLYDTSRISSPGDSPPPDFLLDDDPFANLSAAPTISAYFPTSTSMSTPIPTPPLEALPPKPRSPLTPGSPETKPSFLSSPPSSPISMPGVSRTSSGRTRPAYQKPAFAPRPSLPSLDTLARMNIVLTRKVRKGRVGAGLPFEPWDQLDNEQTSGESSGSQDSSLLGSPITEPSAHPDFTVDLELDFLDLSDDDDTVSPRLASSSTFGQLLHASLVGQDEPSYNADSETSVDEESIYFLSRTSSETSEMSSLTRSTSISSASSTGSSGNYQWPSFGSQNTSMSSTEDSDTLNSPPDDYFPRSHFDPDNIISSYWSSDDLYDSLNGNASGTALYTDVNILGEADIMYEPGTSAGTIRPSMKSKVLRRSPSPVTEPLVDQGEAFDGPERESQRSQSGLGRGWEQGGGSSRRTHGNNAGGDGRGSGSGINRLGRRGDDEDEDDKRVNRSTFSTPSDSESASDEDSTDDYGEPVGAESRVAENSAASSDDDIPLAQRIPTALKAQNTIRRQVREEREQRRIARATRAAESMSTSRGQPFARPPGAGEPSQAAPMSSSTEAALHASRSIRRPRTTTLPAAEIQPFLPDDLTGKLQTMEVADISTSANFRSRSNTTSRGEPNDRSGSRPGSAGRGSRDPGTFQPFTSPPQSPLQEPRSLRPTRSFHRSEGRKLEEHPAVPLPPEAGQRLARSLTRSKDEASGSSPRSYPARISQDETSKQPLARKSGEEPRKLIKVNSETRSARSSSEAERPRPSLQRPPMPPLPPVETLPTSHNTRGPVIQQRVFIGDMQRFNMVEIGPSTNAGDVIEMVEAQGSLKGWVGTGGWMVWEMAQDFGMERPIRSFELLSDVQASWNKDKMMNTFVIKLTPLAVPLSRSAMPSASPTYAGYVEWESKRGKWNKRWLQLREHSLWLSKRDNGKDEVLLCSLSNFDAYFITRLHKAPRPFSFAVKSTDNLSFFENTADYLHIFSCSEKEGNAWMEKILLARSYVLYQEKNVLFNPKASIVAPGGPGPLSRSGTRKTPSRPVQPLLSVAPPISIAQQMQSSDVFEPGSLLRKHV